MGEDALRRVSGDGLRCARSSASRSKPPRSVVRTRSSSRDNIPDANKDRLLVHVHGGGYVLFPGEFGTREAILMAGYGKFKVISIDYRMPPDFPYPAAMDDAMAVWKEVVKTSDPKKMAIFGTSTGGGMTLAMVLRAKKEGLPLPAATAPGTPWSDMTKTGDTFFTNEMVDNILVSNDGWLGDAAKLYANGTDLKDPQLRRSTATIQASRRPSSPRARATFSCRTPCECIASCGKRASSRICTCSRASRTRNMRAIRLRQKRRNISANWRRSSTSIWESDFISLGCRPKTLEWNAPCRAPRNRHRPSLSGSRCRGGVAPLGGAVGSELRL